MLAAILRIKQTRERLAQSEKLTQEKKLALAKQSVEQAEKTLSDYILWRTDQERRRYEEIAGVCISEPELRKLQQEINCLRNKDSQLQEQVELNKKSVHDAHQALHEAEQELKQAQKNVEKYQELNRQEKEARQKLAMQKEDAELEEFVTK